MAMASGTCQDGKLRMADLGFGEEDELLREEAIELTAVGSRGRRRTSAPRKGRGKQTVKVT